MATRPNFSAYLYDKPYLADLAGQMGYVLTRGRGAGHVGSLTSFLNHLQAGEVIAFPAGDEAGSLEGAADTLATLAASLRADDPARALLDATIVATRRAAARQRQLAALVEDDDAPETVAGRRGRYANAEAAKRGAALALFPVVIRFDDGSYDWQHADRPVEHPIGRYEIVARREGAGAWKG